jgi:two-component system, cell cycle sensor histidine kinase and response regulator CckA
MRRFRVVNSHARARRGLWILGVALLLGSGLLFAQAPVPGSPQRPLIVGVNRDYPPYEFLNPKGEVEGYDVDLIRAVARVMGLHLRIQPGPWDQVRRDLEAGRIDVAAGMLKSPERTRLFDFAQPHMVVHYSIFVRKGSPAPSSLEGLRGRKVLVERGSQMHEHLLELGFAASLAPVASEPEALRLLASGHQDAALAPHLEGILQIRNTGLSNLQPVGRPVFSRELCFAVGRGQSELRASLDEGLAILNRTGESAVIYRKWFGSLVPGVMAPLEILRTSLWIVLPLLAATLVALLWNGLLRRRVHRATLQLREANRALQTSESLLQAVIDSLPLMLFVKDSRRDFCFTVWNTKTEELLGIPREEVLGKTDYDLMPAELVDAFRRADQAVLDSGQLLDIPEETVLSPVKGPVLLHTIKVPVPDEGGRPRFLLGISEDLTLFRRIEGELRRSQASLAEAQRIARLGSWEMDLGSGEVLWSDEMYRILGHEPHAFNPSRDSLLQQSHTEDAGLVGDVFRQIAADGAAITLDHRAILADGGERHLVSHVEAQVDGKGRIQRLLGTTQDITERRNSEDALRQTQRLESLGVLAGGIAHDFNNLLTAIMGNLNLSQSLVGGDDPVLPYLQKIEATVLRAANLSRQMLAYSGRGTFLIRPLDLNRLIREMTHLLEVSLSKKVVIHFALDPALPWIEADEGQIQQVVMNLVTNASEAIGDREGHITLATSLRPLDAQTLALRFQGQEMRPGTYVAFEVQDTGCGMGPEVLARLFEPFYTTKFSGRGLGLSAIRGIIKAHGGGIRIDTQASAGSTFHLFFPAWAGSPVADPEGEDAPSPPSRGLILLAEDEPTIRLSTVEMLHALGYQVLEAADGVAAVDAFRAHAPEIRAVLLDLTMPRMDGREALREILLLRPDATVILCSGYHEQEAMQGTEAQVVAGFLPKPYGLRDLQAILALHAGSLPSG